MGATALPLITAGAAGASNLLSTVMTNNSNQKIASENNQTQMDMSQQNLAAQVAENEKNRQFNSDQAALAYQRQRDLWKEQAKYYSPTNVVKMLQDAGINPSVFFGGGSSVAQSSSSPVGAASMHSGLSPVMPNLTAFQRIAPQVGSDVINAISKLAGAKRDVSSGNLSDSQANQINSTLQTTLDSLTEDVRTKKLANDIQSDYGRLLAKTQVAEGVNRAVLLAKQAIVAKEDGDLKVQQQKTEEMKRELMSVEKALKGEERENMRLSNETFMKRFESDMREASSRVSKNVAETRTENELRAPRIEVLKQDARVAKASANAQELINIIDYAIEEDTGQISEARKAELMEKIAKANLAGLEKEEREAITDYIRKQEKFAADKGDWSTAAYWADVVKQIIANIGKGVPAAAAIMTSRGAKSSK